MSYTILTVGSITYAIKAQKLLARAKINAELIKINIADGKSGCSYGIKINSQKMYDAVMVLKLKGIEYSVFNG